MTVGSGRWTLIDPLGVMTDYQFEINPNQMSDPILRKNTTSLGKSPVRPNIRAWRSGRLIPREWTFGGVMRNENQHDVLLAWFALDQRIQLKDHFERVWEIRLTEFNAMPRRSIKSNLLWRFQYTFTANVYQRIS